jgi:hypothetical protein
MSLYLLDSAQERTIVEWLYSKDVQDFLATDRKSGSLHIHLNRESGKVVISANVQANGETMHSGPLCEYKR